GRGREGYGWGGVCPGNNNVASAELKNALFISLPLNCTTHEASCLIARTYSSSGTATPKSSAILTLLLHTERGSSTPGEPFHFWPKADMEPTRRDRNPAVRRPPGGAAMCYRLGGSTDTGAFTARNFFLCERACCSSLDPWPFPSRCWPRWRSRSSIIA